MAAPPNPILLYHPDAYGISRGDLKGRHSAGESFLTAFLAQAEGPEVFALCRADNHFAGFENAVKVSGLPLTARQVGRGDVSGLLERGLMYLPFPDFADEARIRSFMGDDLYAICGLTHTISSRTILDGVADLSVAPVAPWDALICTSRPVHAALTSVFENTEEQLRSRLSANRFTRPMMPVIPLGIHAQRFAHNAAERKRWRSELGIAEDVVAVLFFGRLSVHGKASPFQLAQALEMASQSGRTRFEMIWCGYFHNDFQKTVFMTTAKAMAPSVRFHHVDGRNESARFSIWSAADIFCSLSDNIQESFGLTVIEAMAASLPVIVSNWDGYRESIDHGVDGILIDSYMPAVSLSDSGFRYFSGIDSYDLYIGGLSQFCMVDVAQTAHWLGTLGADAALRRKLGDAAKRRVASSFDWPRILPRYRELWREQLEQITHARRDGIGRASTLRRIYDPSITFGGFPSHHLADGSLLARGPHFEMWDDLVKMPGVVVNPHLLFRLSESQALRSVFADDRAVSIEALIMTFPTDARTSVLRSLHWLVKIGLLKFVTTKSGS